MPRCRVLLRREAPGARGSRFLGTARQLHRRDGRERLGQVDARGHFVRLERALCGRGQHRRDRFARYLGRVAAQDRHNSAVLKLRVQGNAANEPAARQARRERRRAVGSPCEVPAGGLRARIGRSRHGDRGRGCEPFGWSAPAPGVRPGIAARFAHLHLRRGHEQYRRRKRGRYHLSRARACGQPYGHHDLASFVGHRACR